MVKTLPSNAGGVGSIPGLRAKIPHASGPEKRKENRKQQKQYCNKFNKDLKKNFVRPLAGRRTCLPGQKLKFTGGKGRGRGHRKVSVHS